MIKAILDFFFGEKCPKCSKRDCDNWVVYEPEEFNGYPTEETIFDLHADKLSDL